MHERISEQKMVSNKLSRSYSPANILVISPPKQSSYQASKTTAQQPQTTISHLVNSNDATLLYEVEEVSLLAQSNNIKYKLVTSVLMSLIEAPFWMVRRIHYIANHCKNNSWHLLSPLWCLFLVAWGPALNRVQFIRWNDDVNVRLFGWLINI